MASSPVVLPMSTEPTEPIYRRLSKKELLALLDGKPVPGFDLHDPIVQLLRLGLPTTPARTAFAMARRTGFLQIDLGYGLWPDPWVVRQLEEVWWIWCVVRARPPITLTGMPDGEGRLACDLAALERGWTDDEQDLIGQLLGRARRWRSTIWRSGMRWRWRGGWRGS